MVTVRNADEDLIISEATYFVRYKSTVRKTAEKFGRPKTTIHKDITKKLSKVNPKLYRQVRAILNQNADEAHIRGGMATKAAKENQRKI